MDFAVSTMQRDQPLPLCSNNSIISSDVAAGVVINAAGTTFAAALISCTSQVLNPSVLSEILREPSILGKSDECNAIASCDRNHIQLANDRAGYQVAGIVAQRKKVSQGAY